MAINSKFTTDYVIFMKATTDVWGKMPDAQKKNNALYFVVDGPEDDVGRLYLGNTLIADGSGITEIGIEKLSDVSLANVSTGDILVYNLNSRKWENISLEGKIGDLIKPFVGATETSNGVQGLVPAPAIEDRNKYLRGDKTWGDPTVEVRNDLNQLDAVVKVLVGNDAGSSVRSIATTIAADAASAAVTTILDGAPEAFDTLKEVATWISKHPTTENFVNLDNRVGNLEDLLHDRTDEEGKVTAGLISVVNGLASTSENLSGRVVILENNFNNLNQGFTIIQNDMQGFSTTLNSHTDKITALEERLTWQLLYEE